MNERERLVELLSNAKKYATNIMLHLNIDEAIDISYDDLQADYLLENGVIVLPRKLNLPDELYRYMFDDDRQPVPVKCKVVKITGYGFTLKHPTDGREWDYKYNRIGKTVFLTKEETEKALKGGEGDG